jgi:hypothetical protein
MDAESQLLADKDAEIERLKALITELADWIENCGEATAQDIPMLQRAREVTK